MGDGVGHLPAASTRATGLAGLPGAGIAAGPLDLFIGKNLDHAKRLMRVGVLAELHLCPGACLGFALAADAGVAKVALRSALGTGGGPGTDTPGTGGNVTTQN